MKLEITIGSQQLTFLAIFLIALAFMGIVAAYGGSQPSVMGHSAGELDLAPLYISGGKVGIGTTSPGEALEVVGDIVTSGTICDSGGTNCIGGSGGFNPASYNGGESVTFPNGLILKMGFSNSPATTVTFGTPFPNGIVSVQATQRNSAAGMSSDQEVRVYSVTRSSFSYRIIVPNADSAIYWLAIGY